MTRKAISKSTRFRIFARDGFTCRYCGAQSDTVALEVDHIIPVVEGGTNDDENLITACLTCNRGKSAKRLESIAPTEQDRLRLAQERNEQVRAAEAAREAAEARKEFRQTVVDLWCHIRGRDEVHSRTISVMVRYAEEYGIERVGQWISMAHEKLPWASDQRLGMYISGIRRQMLAEGEL